ncbi:MAG: DsbA family protein [Halieaceae bacterium]|nr:DsbA family protein [Halieaceae bacterium]
MAEQFEDQGGAATMNPPALARWMQSRVMSAMVREGAEERRHSDAEKARVKQGKAHCIEYFHQVDDPYSVMAAQCLPALMARYPVEWKIHLVSGADGRNNPEPDMLLPLARYDAALVAPYYALHFPSTPVVPTTDQVELARRALCDLPVEQFAAAAERVGLALFTPGSDLAGVLDTLKLASVDEARAALQAGDAHQSALKHYSGGMFYYGGDWYWGVDRLYLLESRLQSLGIGAQGEGVLYPRPAIDPGTYKANGSLTLEAYVSLRSPYTAISFDEAVALCDRAGVRLEVKPVLPMVMRGVSLTRTKGMYIFRDTAREARARGGRFGPFYDPIGNPVRQAYSLFPWAREQGKSVAYISAFLSAAFMEGTNTNNDRGLRKVVEAAGLDWSEAQRYLGSRGWEEELEANRLQMLETGSWGVPSFRLLDSEGEEVCWAWGQDRLWVMAREIQRLLVQA